MANILVEVMDLNVQIPRLDHGFPEEKQEEEDDEENKRPFHHFRRLREEGNLDWSDGRKFAPHTMHST